MLHKCRYGATTSLRRTRWQSHTPYSSRYGSDHGSLAHSNDLFKGSPRESRLPELLAAPLLPTETGGRDALDDLPLEIEENEHQRQRGEDRGGHILRVALILPSATTGVAAAGEYSVLLITGWADKSQCQ